MSIPQLADLLIERTQQQSWVIVFKSLVTIHNLMNYGNEVSLQVLYGLFERNQIHHKTHFTDLRTKNTCLNYLVCTLPIGIFMIFLLD